MIRSLCLIRIAVALALWCATVAQIAAQQPCESARYRLPVDSVVTIFRELSYGDAPVYSPSGVGRTLPLKFDFYEPHNDATPRRPFVLIVPDSAKVPQYWKRWAEQLAQNGYACAVMTYRDGYSAGDFRSVVRADFRVAQDVDAALRYFWGEAQVYGLDSEHFFVLAAGRGAAGALQATTLQADARHPFTRGTDREPYDQQCRSCTGNPYATRSLPVAGIITLRGHCIDLPVRDRLDGLRALLIDDGAEVWPTDVRRSLSPLYRTGRGLWSGLAQSGAVARRLLSAPMPMDSLLLRHWTTVQAFLYLNLEFQTPTPSGPLVACAGEPTVYQLPTTTGGYADCCWIARGGTVVESGAGKATIAWDYGESEGALIAVASNASGMSGLPSDTLQVQIRAVAKSAFTLAQKAPNVIALTDASNAGSYFIIDFGDGSPPQSGSLGEQLVHTYDLAGRYLITQTLFNNCGTTISNQYVEIEEVTSDAWQSLKAALPVPDTVRLVQDTLVLALHRAAIYNPVLRVIVKPVAAGERVYDAWVTVPNTSAIKLPRTALRPGRYELLVSADANTVKQYFEVVEPTKPAKAVTGSRRR